MDLFGRRRDEAAAYAPEGQVIYAVGDIHGRLDLLNLLLDKITDDIAGSKREEATLAFLGDYVDRGPDSRLVLETLKQLKDLGGEKVVTLKGNHEQALLRFLDDPEAGPAWLQHGGRETLISYDVAPPLDSDPMETWARVRDAFAAALPLDHHRFLSSLGLWATAGDYLFVHAGVKPGVPLLEQTENDLLWVRDSFLRSPRALDKVVVHGHTPFESPQVQPGRIGVDTGAYATGVLTAVKLVGCDRTFIQATL